MFIYHFEEPGNVVNCRIFDQEGHMIRDLANNVSVGCDGFLRWDGERDGGDRARAGYYAVLFEYFNTDGQMRSVRRRVAIAPR